jgi:hypothetical protein
MPAFPAPPPVAAPPAAPGAPPARVVTKYTLFQNVDIGGGMTVSTGWRYEASSDRAPSRQYCYLQFPAEPGAPNRTADLANTVEGRLPFEAMPVVPQGQARDILDRALYERAMSNCVWFPGTDLPAFRPSPSTGPQAAGPQAAAPAAPAEPPPSGGDEAVRPSPRRSGTASRPATPGRRGSPPCRAASAVVRSGGRPSATLAGGGRIARTA